MGDKVVGKTYITSDYNKFDPHTFNRKIQLGKAKAKKLESLMLKTGFVTHKPLEVLRNGSNGKLKIVAGHHRFAVAKKHNIPLKYQVIKPDEYIDIIDDEGASRPWDLFDFATGHLCKGNPHYQVVYDYHERTGISLSICISLLGCGTAGTYAKVKAFKEGRFVLGSLTHAITVEKIVNYLKSAAIKFATNTNLVRAISHITWVNGFQIDELCNKIKAHKYLIKKKPSVEGYMDMIEEIYNRQRKKTEKIPLTYMANQAIYQRSAINK